MMRAGLMLQIMPSVLVSFLDAAACSLHFMLKAELYEAPSRRDRASEVMLQTQNISRTSKSCVWPWCAKAAVLITSRTVCTCEHLQERVSPRIAQRQMQCISRSSRVYSNVSPHHNLGNTHALLKMCRGFQHGRRLL